MPKLRHEKDFKLDEYEEFYEHHYFQPFDDATAIQAHRRLPRVGWAVDVAQEVKPKHVLDLGCLEGFTALTIANKVSSVETSTGVDLSQEGIDIANTRKELVRADMTFVRDTIEHFLATTDKKFDFICLFEVIEHVLDPEELIKLIDKVKTDDATILISTPAFEAPTYGKNDVQNKCHIRLFTTEDDDYEEMTDVPDPDTGKTYMRTASSLPKLIGKDRIKTIGVYSQLINCMMK